MKQNISGPAAVIVILAVLAVAVAFVWKQTGPRTDGPSKPVNMAEMMQAGKGAPPPGTNRAPGQPPSIPQNPGR